MSLRKITTPAVPEPPGGSFTNCYVLDRQVFMAGQVSGGEGMEFGKVRAEFFPGEKPCSTLVEVKGLALPEYLIEVDVTAVLGAERK